MAEGSAGALPLKEDTNNGDEGEVGGEEDDATEEGVDVSDIGAGVALKVPFPPVTVVESASCKRMKYRGMSGSN
jgi:hypothetical protein